MRHALRAVLPPEVCRHLSKDDPARYEPLRDVLTRALPAVGEDLAARLSPPSRACYVDVPRLLDSLDADRVRADRQNVPVCNALQFLDW